MRAYWDLKITATSVDEAKEILKKFTTFTGLSITGDKYEQYWKMPELRECNFETEGFPDNAGDVLTQLNKTLKKLGSPWEEAYKEIYENDKLEYSTTIDCRRSEVYFKELFWGHCQFSGMIFFAREHTSKGS